ncbi:MAG: ComEC/Rec2 family competence protein [Clostridia bacterium]
MLKIMQLFRFFNYRPMLIMALGALFGILIFSETYRDNNIIAIIISLIVVIISIIFKKRAIALFAIAFFIFTFRTFIFYPSKTPEDGMRVISGTVCKEGKTAVLNNAKINSVLFPGKILIDSDVELSYGETVYAYGYVHFSNNMEDYLPHYYISNGIFAVTRIKRPYAVPNEPTIFTALSKIKLEIESSINRNFINSAFIKGMILGDTADLNYETKLSVQNSGVAHILSLSGLHVSIIAGCLTYLFAPFNRWVRLFFITVFLTFYTAMTGFSPSLLRASIMFLCYLFGKCIYRRPDSLSSLSFAFLVIVAINPYFIYSCSFALSFCAMIGIILISSALTRISVPRKIRPFTNSISLSIGASIGTFCPLSAYFKQIPLFSPIANLVAIPAASVALIFAFFGIAISFLYEPLILPFSFIADFFSNIVLSTASAISDLSFAVVSVPVVPIISGILFSLSLFFVSGYSLKRKSINFLCAVALAAIAILIYLTQ